jgi:hypothetical protein
MLNKELCIPPIKAFRAKHGLDTPDENIIAAIHLMSTHGVDVHAALDQSSRSASDCGIDAWHYAEQHRLLTIYQSKLSESRTQALNGFRDLDRARKWLEEVVIDGKVNTVPSENHCLFNLYTRLADVRESLHRIKFVLLSLFEQDEIEDTAEYRDFESELIKSPLNSFMTRQLGGSMAVSAMQYNLESRLPENVKVYPIPRIPDSRIQLRRNSHLDLAYVTLYSLVELYRKRGDILFDKNVRLSLTSTKEARDRLVHPMEDTLTQIVSGKLSPSALSQLNFRVDRLELAAGVIDLHLPLDSALRGVDVR